MGYEDSPTGQPRFPDFKSTIGEFITILGVPVVVSTTTKGDAYVQGGGPMIVDVLIKDAHGNTVADGTSVNISVQGSAILNDYNAGTVNGQARFLCHLMKA